MGSSLGSAMSFLPQEPSTFVNVKLTDTGRQLLSLGELKYTKAVLSDREIDYNIDRTGVYNILLNRVMTPKDDQPKLPPYNFDGTPPISLQSNLLGGTVAFSAYCASRGMYSGNTSVTGTTIPTVHDYVLDTSLRLSVNDTEANKFIGDTGFNVTSGVVMNGGLIFIVFSNPSGGGSANIDSNAPFVALWYRSTGTTNTLYTDRITPDFSPAGSTELSRIHYYPWNGNTYYGSAITVDTRVWNLNIVRSSSEIGTALGESGYTTYGSMEYNGQKHYLGFDEEYRQIGLIHFTNEFTGNTYGHEFVPGTTEVDIPHLLWHRHESIEGEGELAGQRFSDSGSGVWSDPIALTTYTLLTDENTVDPWVVGRVYPKLKLIAITDPELLTALTYKSNRNWTLPPLITSRRSTPAPGYSVFDVEGSLSSGKTYYVTYGIDMRGDWNATKGFGYKPVLHCGYIQKVTGATDGEGRSAYLSAKFSSPSFPYLRSLAGMTAFSGTGWNANGMYIIMKEVDTTSDRGPDNVGADGWTAMTTKYGYYAGGEDGADTINPSYAINYEFIVDRDDLTGGTPYVLDTTFTENIDYKLSGNTINMTLGNECFFFGNIRTGIKRTTYKTVIFLEAATDQFNSSQNPTFYQGVDTSTYFTEIGILDDENRLVAVGKTSRPIEKNDAQHLVIQLELEF